jgi:outer membrane lipoprotein-sorting protein
MLKATVLLLFLSTLSARDIVDKAYNRDVPKSSMAKSKMIIVNEKGEMREREILTYTAEIKGIRKSLIKFLEPADVKDTSFLHIENPKGEDEQFLYIPAIKKTRRIAGSQRSSSFMGSDFSYSDFEKRDVDAGEHSLIKEENYNGQDVYVVESIPRDEPDYSKFVQWIRKDNFVPVRIDFYDKKGNLIKRLEVEKLENIDGYWISTKTVMQSLTKNKKTVIEIIEIKNNIEIPEKYFLPQNLGKI